MRSRRSVPTPLDAIFPAHRRRYVTSIGCTALYNGDELRCGRLRESPGETPGKRKVEGTEGEQLFSQMSRQAPQMGNGRSSSLRETRTANTLTGRALSLPETSVSCDAGAAFSPDGLEPAGRVARSSMKRLSVRSRTRTPEVRNSSLRFDLPNPRERVRATEQRDSEDPPVAGASQMTLRRPEPPGDNTRNDRRQKQWPPKSEPNWRVHGRPFSGCRRTKEWWRARSPESRRSFQNSRHALN